jgi:hypothetical protein
MQKECMITCTHSHRGVLSPGSIRSRTLLHVVAFKDVSIRTCVPSPLFASYPDTVALDHSCAGMHSHIYAFAPARSLTCPKPHLGAGSVIRGRRTGRIQLVGRMVGRGKAQQGGQKRRKQGERERTWREGDRQRQQTIKDGK